MDSSAAESFHKVRVDRTRGVQQPSKLKIAEFDSPYPLQNMFKIKDITRPCDGCTKCCEGWLSGTAYGYNFSPYKKCHFLKNGCGIYPARPNDPCKTFVCEWKANNIFPEWLKPDKAHVIILKRRINDKYYYIFSSTGKLVDKKVFEWAESFSKETKHNIVIENMQKFSVYSQDKDFLVLIKEKYNIGV